MDLLPSVRNFHNSKLFFSKNELSKILSCYSIGVSKGSWKDYAIFFGNHEVSFCMFKHSLASPDCILTNQDCVSKISITPYKMVLSQTQIVGSKLKRHFSSDTIMQLKNKTAPMTSFLLS